MMTVLTSDDLAPFLQRLATLEARQADLERQLDRPLTIAEACAVTGLSRSTLYLERARAKRGESLLKEVAHGRKSVLMHSTCVAFRQARELGVHRLNH